MNLSRSLWFVTITVCFLFLNLSFCCYSLNEEGNALLKLKKRITSDPFDALLNWVDDEVVLDPCDWFGVECSDTKKVVILNLKDLCLEGTLAPELMNLVHIKSIILRNNSFYGTIPEEIVSLKELEILDLGYNNLSGNLDANFGQNFQSLAILLLDNNELLVGFSPKINELKMLSECQVDESRLTDEAKFPSCSKRSITWHVHENEGPRKLIAYHKQSRHARRNDTSRNDTSHNQTSPLYRFPPSHSPSAAAVPTVPNLASDSPNQNAPDSPNQNASDSPTKTTSSKKNKVPILAGVIIGGAVFLVISSIGIYLCKTNKVAIVKPWTTGISGQLQKALVTGVPKLKRSDLEAACEDFSNVIGDSPIGTLYKGTLSSGVEIAVASVSVMSKNWTKALEAQFRKKIDTLSKVNHKNFVNLIGYCEEEEPFTRMLVFEYAPNGTLFEHLHVKEAEHLNWIPRLRIAMGMAYCLQHMHELDPPVVLTNLSSSAVHLTDDYAAKVSDLSFSYEIDSSEKKPDGKKQNDMMQSTSPASNVYNFGVLLFEMVTGRIPYSVDNSSHENWASHYLKWDKPLKEMVDSTLTSYQEDQVEQVAELIRVCVDPDSEKRPRMNEVSERLREITKMSPEFVVPKLSPLWWAEIEISSA
ncbi:putative inactive receptor protein kinase [Trifolium repens]|nr:putative inactive receptor protein kinase [Trifolium repens]